MNQLGNIIALAYGVACIGVAIYLVVLASRFVRAHERMADALDKIARKPEDDRKPDAG